MPAHLYPPVGKCIYCGETKLAPGTSRFGDEHIIPFALGGNLVLPEASCKRCEAIINRQIETPVLSHEWGNLRSRRNFPSRNRSAKKKKTHLIVTDIHGAPLRIPLKDHSTPTLMYKFGEARILSGLPYGSDDLRWTITVLGDHAEEMEMHKKYPTWDKHHKLKAQPHEFSRLLAKIAYGYIVAEWGLGGFMPLGLEIILGKSTDYFFTVGGTWDIHPAIPAGDHITDISLRVVSPRHILIVVDIRLFSQMQTPSYHVVVGHIDPQNSEHVAVFEKHRLDGKIEQLPRSLV